MLFISASLVLLVAWSRMGMSMFFLLIFITGLGATVVSFLVSLLFGADHDADHDIDHDIDHDVDHDADHDADHHDVGAHSGGDHASILSIKIFMLFVTGFGGGGFAGAQANFGVGISSLLALVGGCVFAVIGYGILDFFHRSQASSAVRTNDLIGVEGVVCTTIPPNGIGEISCDIRGQQLWFAARTNQADPIKTGSRICITGLAGSISVVEPLDKTSHQTQTKESTHSCNH